MTFQDAAALLPVLDDAVKVPVGAEEDLAVGNGGGRVARFSQIIHGQNLKLLRVRPKDGGHASSAGDIQSAGGQDDRAPAFASVEAFGPEGFPGLTIHALGSSRSGVDNVCPAIDDHA